MEKRHRLIIDIGNSRVKYYFAGVTYYDTESLYKCLESGYNHIIDSFIIAAKHEIGESFWLEFQGSFFRDNICPGNSYLFDLQKETPLEATYQGLGGDRITKLTGALAMFPGHHIMLMDFGTATTLNLATKDYKFRGGFVHLGLQVSIEAIPLKLEGFPDYTNSDAFRSLVAGVNCTDVFPEESAAKAVIEGAYREQFAMIRYYKDYAAEKFHGESFISIATGGSGMLFRSEFDHYIDSRELLESFVLKWLES